MKADLKVWDKVTKNRTIVIEFDQDNEELAEQVEIGIRLFRDALYQLAENVHVDTMMEGFTVAVDRDDWGYVMTSDEVWDQLVKNSDELVTAKRELCELKEKLAKLEEGSDAGLRKEIRCLESRIEWWKMQFRDTLEARNRLEDRAQRLEQDLRETKLERDKMLQQRDDANAEAGHLDEQLRVIEDELREARGARGLAKWATIESRKKLKKTEAKLQKTEAVLDEVRCELTNARIDAVRATGLKIGDKIQTVHDGVLEVLAIIPEDEFQIKVAMPDGRPDAFMRHAVWKHQINKHIITDFTADKALEERLERCKEACDTLQAEIDRLSPQKYYQPGDRVAVPGLVEPKTWGGTVEEIRRGQVWVRLDASELTLSYEPNSIKPLTFKIGEEVYHVNRYMEGTVVKVKPGDAYPYLVRWENGEDFWSAAEFMQRLDETPESQKRDPLL